MLILVWSFTSNPHWFSRLRDETAAASGRPWDTYRFGTSAGPAIAVFSDRDGLDISDFSIHQQRACISISLYRTFISPLLARSRSRNTRALTLFTNNHIRIFAQDAWRKGKVHRWKGWLQGCGGESPEVSQRKGWSAGELFGWAGGVGRRWKNLR